MKNIYNVISDVAETVRPHDPLNYSVEHVNDNRWIVRVKSPRRGRSAKFELILDDNTESVIGSLLRHRGFSRRQVDTIMDAIVERF